MDVDGIFRSFAAQKMKDIREEKSLSSDVAGDEVAQAVAASGVDENALAQCSENLPSPSKVTGKEEIAISHKGDDTQQLSSDDEDTNKPKKHKKSKSKKDKKKHRHKSKKKKKSKGKSSSEDEDKLDISRSRSRSVEEVASDALDSGALPSSTVGEPVVMIAEESQLNNIPLHSVTGVTDVPRQDLYSCVQITSAESEPSTNKADEECSKTANSLSLDVSLQLQPYTEPDKSLQSKSVFSPISVKQAPTCEEHTEPTLCIAGAAQDVESLPAAKIAKDTVHLEKSIVDQHTSINQSVTPKASDAKLEEAIAEQADIGLLKTNLTGQLETPTVKEAIGTEEKLVGPACDINPESEGIPNAGITADTSKDASELKETESISKEHSKGLLFPSMTFKATDISGAMDVEKNRSRSPEHRNGSPRQAERRASSSPNASNRKQKSRSPSHSDRRRTRSRSRSNRGLLRTEFGAKRKTDSRTKDDGEASPVRTEVKKPRRSADKSRSRDDGRKRSHSNSREKIRRRSRSRSRDDRKNKSRSRSRDRKRKSRSRSDDDRRKRTRSRSRGDRKKRRSRSPSRDRGRRSRSQSRDDKRKRTSRSRSFDDRKKRHRSRSRDNRRKKSRSRSRDDRKKRSRSRSHDRRKRSLSGGRRRSRDKRKSRSRSSDDNRKASSSRVRNEACRSRREERRRKSSSREDRRIRSSSRSRDDRRKRSCSRTRDDRGKKAASPHDNRSKKSSSRSRDESRKRSRSRSRERKKRSRSGSRDGRSKLSSSPPRSRDGEKKPLREDRKKSRSRSADRKKPAGYFTDDRSKSSPFSRKDRNKSRSRSPNVADRSGSRERRRRSRSTSRKRRSNKSPLKLTELDKAQLLEIAKANASVVNPKVSVNVMNSIGPAAALFPLILQRQQAVAAAVAAATTMANAVAVTTASVARLPVAATTSMSAPAGTSTTAAVMAQQPDSTGVDKVNAVVAATTKGFKMTAINDLTKFCKQLAESKDDGGPVNKPVHSDDEDAGLDEALNKAPFIHHPFKLNEPKPIAFSLNNLMVKPLQLKPPQATLSKEFPVSSGNQHRQKEQESVYGQWVPVEKSSAEETDDKHRVFPKPVVGNIVDLGAVITKRAVAVQRLAQNPTDMEAMLLIARSQRQIESWAQASTEPGTFTGSTGVQILSPQELANTGQQAWLKKDQFLRAAPVNGGIGAQLMRKMGWSEGKGLGKNSSGSVEPIIMDFKTDRRGLLADGEKAQKKSGPLTIMKDLSGKHPVSALMEICTKRKWMAPDFIVVNDSGPDHRKNFLFKVIVNGCEYQPTTASPNKKHAKAMAATVVLQSMGLVPRNKTAS